MHRISHMKYGATEDALVVEIPYDRNETSMLVVLPKKRGNLKAIESKLTAKASPSGVHRCAGIACGSSPTTHSSS
jgi:serine protease inhibitor